jgi:hypothetical protein
MSIFAPAMLAIEAQQVIALRMAKLAFGGPAAMFEASRMVTEKLNASMQAAGMVSVAMMNGEPDGGADQVVHMLRKEVRANRRRLSK